MGLVETQLIGTIVKLKENDTTRKQTKRSR